MHMLNLYMDSRNSIPNPRDLVFCKSLSDNFKLMKQKVEGPKDKLYVVLDDFDLCIAIKKDGYIPKSALHLIKCVNQFDLAKKRVLDLGCGETGILAHYAFARKAKQVVGVDIDPSAIAHVKKASVKSSRIRWVVSDLFYNLGNCLFDIILTNPPQLPMSDYNRMELADWHDVSGPTGRELILRILKEGHRNLDHGGEIYMLIFDFLGITQSFNSMPGLAEISKELGYSCVVLQNFPVLIRVGGKIEKNLAWIRQIYPCYTFQQSELGLHYNISIVRFKLQMSQCQV